MAPERTPKEFANLISTGVVGTCPVSFCYYSVVSKCVEMSGLCLQ